MGFTDRRSKPRLNASCEPKGCATKRTRLRRRSTAPRVVEDERRDGRLGIHHVALGQLDADLLRRAAGRASPGRRGRGRPDSRSCSACRGSGPGSGRASSSRADRGSPTPRAASRAATRRRPRRSRARAPGGRGSSGTRPRPSAPRPRADALARRGDEEGDRVGRRRRRSVDARVDVVGEAEPLARAWRGNVKQASPPPGTRTDSVLPSEVAPRRTGTPRAP